MVFLWDGRIRGCHKLLGYGSQGGLQKGTNQSRRSITLFSAIFLNWSLSLAGVNPRSGHQFEKTLKPNAEAEALRAFKSESNSWLRQRRTVGFFLFLFLLGKKWQLNAWRFHRAYFPRGKWLKIPVKAGSCVQQKGITCPLNDYYLHPRNKGLWGTARLREVLSATGFGIAQPLKPIPSLLFPSLRDSRQNLMKQMFSEVYYGLC